MKAPPPPATVYLVDDDPSVLRAVARVVRAAGLLVAGFSSPKEFLARLDIDNLQEGGLAVRGECVLSRDRWGAEHGHPR